MKKIYCLGVVLLLLICGPTAKSQKARLDPAKLTLLIPTMNGQSLYRPSVLISFDSMTNLNANMNVNWIDNLYPEAAVTTFFGGFIAYTPANSGNTNRVIFYNLYTGTEMESVELSFLPTALASNGLAVYAGGFQNSQIIRIQENPLKIDPNFNLRFPPPAVCNSLIADNHTLYAWISPVPARSDIGSILYAVNSSTGARNDSIDLGTSVRFVKKMGDALIVASQANGNTTLRFIPILRPSSISVAFGTPIILRLNGLSANDVSWGGDSNSVVNSRDSSFYYFTFEEGKLGRIKNLTDTAMATININPYSETPFFNALRSIKINRNHAFITLSGDNDQADGRSQMGAIDLLQFYTNPTWIFNQNVGRLTADILMFSPD